LSDRYTIVYDKYVSSAVYCKIAEDRTKMSQVNTVGIDRSEVSRALAKAIAYKQCGKDADAEAWARRLVELLQCSEILKEEVR
jgi:hypothetical protein